MTTRRARLERLLALREAGITMSRNAHFEVFDDPRNREALSLHRYLDALAGAICDERAEAHLGPAEHNNGVVLLTLHHPDLGARHCAHLERHELAELVDRDGVASRLDALGITWRPLLD